MNLWQKTLLLLLLFATTSQGQTFTELSPSPFTGTGWSSVDVSDVNNDGFVDVMISGEASGGIRISKLYLNSSLGIFAEQVESPFDGVYRSTVSFSDIDKDNDEDLLITGMNNDEVPTTKFYINDGLGNFTLDETNKLPGIYFSSVAFADVDADNDPDLFITGSTGQDNSIAKLFINDGSGFFEESSQNLFEGVHQSSIAFNDIDLDSDYDLIITGHNGSGGSTKLYKNDGSGNFSEELNIPFDNVYASSIAFGDIENDGDDDLLITGFSKEVNKPISKLYTNDGLGNFVENTKSTFQDFVLSSVSFTDMNADGFQDILMNGFSQSIGITTAYYYRNNENGTFAFAGEIKPATTNIIPSSLISFDADNDSDLDIFITGPVDSTRKAKLYLSELKECITTTSYDTVSACNSFKWIDGKTYTESNSEASITLKDYFGCDSIVNLRLTINHSVFIYDSVVTKEPYRWYFKNNFKYYTSSVQDSIFIGSSCDTIGVLHLEIIRDVTAGGFTRDTLFKMSRLKHYSFGDLDGDGDNDLLLSGNFSGSGSETFSYLKNDERNFIPNGKFEIEDFVISKCDFLDLDEDGDNDLLCPGLNKKGNVAYSTKILLNAGKGSFTENSNMEMPYFFSKHVIFEDFDKDGDKDLIATGETMEYRDFKYHNIPQTIYYKNQGEGNFTLVTDSPFKNSNYDISIGDFNNDSFTDIIVNGFDWNTLQSFVILYLGKGNGEFEESHVFDKDFKSAKFGRVNSDNISDIILLSYSNPEVSVIFGNNSTSLSAVENVIKPYNTSLHNLTIGDFDNDGDTDMIANTSSWPFLLLNNGDGVFEKVPESPFLARLNGLGLGEKVLDIDNDGYLDLISDNQIYYNDGCIPEYVFDSVVSYYPFTWINGKTYSESNFTDRLVLKNEAGCDSVVYLHLEVKNTPRGAGFIDQTDESMTRFLTSQVAVGDLNGDNELDLVLSGRNLGYLQTSIYFNQGDREFKVHSQPSFYTHASRNEIRLVDIENDGDLDIVVANDSLIIYINNGSGLFEKSAQFSDLLISNSTIEFGDVNGDGFQDLFTSGNIKDKETFSYIYINNGKGDFEKKVEQSIEGFIGNALLRDIDNDSDLDLVIAGALQSGKNIFQIYRNDGEANLSLYESNIKALDNPIFSSEDLDNDNDIDIIINGKSQDNGKIISTVYLNDGSGFFEEKQTENITGVIWGDIEIGDLDNDSDMDILITGQAENNNLTSTLYLNNGDATFEIEKESPFVPLFNVASKFADLDNDKALDVILSGRKIDYNSVTKIFYNERGDEKCNPTYHTDHLESDVPITWIDGKVYDKNENAITYTLTNSAGCDSIITLNLTIIEIDSNNCEDSFYTDIIESFEPVQWIDDNIYTQSVDSITHSLTNSAGCDSIITLNLTIKQALSTQEVETKNTIKLYPNPSGAQLKFDIGYQPEKKLEYQIFNTSGLEIKTWESNFKEQLIDISPLASGTYILKYQEGLKSESLKFVKR